MATTVHIPTELLERLDARARELGISRNRYVIQALERAIAEETEWSPQFLEALADAAKDTDSHEAVDEMMRVIRSERRSRKKPISL